MYSNNKPRGTSARVAGCLVLGSAGAALAHGIGHYHDLPVPLWLYVTGAAAAVAFSFVAIGVFMQETPGRHTYPRFNLLQSAVGRCLAHPALLACLRWASVGLFVLCLLTGLFGTQGSTQNLTPTLVWVIWWVGRALADHARQIRGALKPGGVY
jgi:hypothetical protein